MPKAIFKSGGKPDNRFIKITFIDDDGKEYPIVVVQKWLDKDIDETQEL